MIYSLFSQWRDILSLFTNDARKRCGRNKQLFNLLIKFFLTIPATENFTFEMGTSGVVENNIPEK